MQDWIRIYWPLVLLVGLQLLFLIAPQTDVWISDRFFQTDAGFLLSATGLVSRIEALMGALLVFSLLLLPWLWLSSAYWIGAGEKQLRRRLVFLFLVLAIAPVLAVGLLGDTSGRAAPSIVGHFGGLAQFTGAFVPALECAKDCSFVSRSSAIGFTLIALAWAFGARRWLWIGLLTGAVVGLIEIAAGQRFFSDVLFAYWVVYGTCLLMARLLLGTYRVKCQKQ